MNEDYLKFYETKLVEPLTELDEERKKVIKNRIALTVIAALCILIHSLLIVVEVIKYPLTIFITLFALPLLAYFIYKQFFDKINDIADSLKELISREVLLANVSASGGYKEDYFISYIDFLQSQQYNLQPEHYKGKHYVKGGKLATMASIIEAGFENMEGEWENIFNGYFMICEEKFMFRGFTIVRPDDTHQNLGLLGLKLKETSFGAFEGLKKSEKDDNETFEYLKMPNREFNKNFAVYSNNLTESYTILNEVVINTIMALQEEYGVSIGLTISPTRIYASVAFPDDQFEFNHWKTLLNPEKYANLYTATEETVNLIHRIGLSFIKKELRIIT
jgi:hypothetical protein